MSPKEAAKEVARAFYIESVKPGVGLSEAKLLEYIANSWDMFADRVSDEHRHFDGGGWQPDETWWQS